MDTPVQYSENIYTAGATHGYNNFTPPDYVADSGGYTYFTSTLVVEVNGVTRSDYTLSSTVDFTSALTAGDVVRIYRTTTRTTPLVVFPNTTQLDSQKHLNKSAWNLLWIIQEIWTFLYGCLYKSYSSAHSALVYNLGSTVVTGGATPTETTDLTTKAYVDATVAAGDAATLTAAQAYIINLVAATTAAVTGATMVQNTQSIIPGQTTIVFPVTFSVGIIIFNGSVQRPGIDYTHTAGTATITVIGGVPTGVNSVDAYLF